MVISMKCACGKSYRFPEEFAGTEFSCWSCKQTLSIPEAPNTPLATSNFHEKGPEAIGGQSSKFHRTAPVANDGPLPLPLPSPPASPPEPLMSLISVCAPFLGIVLYFLKLLVAPPGQYEYAGWIGVGFRYIAVFGMLGLLAAILSAIRGEQPWWIASLGFLINLLVAMLAGICLVGG